jgi:hypothetical protein
MKRALLVPLVFLAALSSALAQEEDVAAFFHGKTLRLVVGVCVGSGYDINARLLARHVAAHIPGQPTIVVQNQPGAGSLTMTNALYNTWPFDGTALGASFNGMPTTPLLLPTGVRFDPVKLNWLGSTNRETQAMYVWHTAPAQVLEDTRSKEIVMGAQAPGSTQFDYPVLANKLFGFKFKVVTATRARRKSISRWRAAGLTAPSPTGRRSRPSIRIGSRKRKSAFSRSGRCRRAPNSTTSRCFWMLPRPRASAPRCG